MYLNPSNGLIAHNEMLLCSGANDVNFKLYVVLNDGMTLPYMSLCSITTTNGVDLNAI